MSDLDVGKWGEYNANGQWVPCVIVEYVPGREGGDHRVAGFTNTKQQKSGQPDYFNVWSTPGSKPGNFRL